MAIACLLWKTEFPIKKSVIKMLKEYLFTSESVSEGHPDKVADQISDAVVDAFMAQDPNSRVAVETLTTSNLVVLAGEVRSDFTPDYDAIVRDTIGKIGYNEKDFNPQGVEIINRVHKQAGEIAQGVDAGSKKEEGAGDQGLMFGYATKQTESLMPAPVYYAHKILEELAKKRHGGEIRLGPDAKSQVTLQFENGIPKRADTVLVSHQHTADISQEELSALIKPVLQDVMPDGWVDEKTRFIVNPTGSFVQGGPGADAGLTGRKIIVDTYGGMSRHGGGAFSGKDHTKVDRSAAYAARYLAKNIVAADLADHCEIQLCYAIGVPEPLAIYLDTFDSIKGNLSEENIIKAIRKSMSLTPRGIREHLRLAKPIYQTTASYGHFGREPIGDTFPWEKTDLAEVLTKNL